jgi:hypothetical protein
MAQDRVGLSETGRPGIVGAWTLDKDLSDRSDGMGRGDGNRGMGGSPGMGGGGGRGGGMPGGFGGGGDRRDPEENRRISRIMTDLLTPAGRLTVVQDGPVIMVTTDDGRAVKWNTDGKEQERLTGDGIVKSRARWNSAQFVVEERIQDGPKVTRTFIVSADGRQLMLVTKIDGGGGMPMQPIVHHVYTRNPQD